MTQRSRRNATLLATAAFFLAGCQIEIAHPFGHEVGNMIESQSLKGSESQTPAGAEKAMYRAFGVLQTGDSEALYELLSQECRHSVGSRWEYALHVHRTVAEMELRTGWNFAEMELVAVDIVHFTLARAAVANTYDVGDGTTWSDDSSAVFVYENGYWKSECDE